MRRYTRTLIHYAKGASIEQAEKKLTSLFGKPDDPYYGLLINAQRGKEKEKTPKTAEINVVHAPKIAQNNSEKGKPSQSIPKAAISAKGPNKTCSFCNLEGHSEEACFRKYPKLGAALKMRRHEKKQKPKGRAAENEQTVKEEVTAIQETAVSIGAINIGAIRSSELCHVREKILTNDACISKLLEAHYTSQYPHNKPVIMGKADYIPIEMLLDIGADLSIIAISEIRDLRIRSKVERLRSPIICYPYDYDNQERNGASRVPLIEQFVLLKLEFLWFNVNFPVIVHPPWILSRTHNWQ